MIKTCTKCNIEKELSYFDLNKREEDGFYKICKMCRVGIRFNYNHSPKGRYYCYKNDARRRGYEFKLSFDDFIKFWNKDCFYCGDKVIGIGLDRKDSSIGYKIENVVSCCSICNFMKQCYSVDDFISQCIKIVKNHN